MSWLWIIPIAIVGFGAVTVTFALRAIAVETANLRRELAGLTELQGAIAGVRDKTADVSDAVAGLRRRPLISRQ